MLSAIQAAGAQNTQSIVTAVGGTALVFLLVALVVVLAMRSGWVQERYGYGRDPYQGGGPYPGGGPYQGGGGPYQGGGGQYQGGGQYGGGSGAYRQGQQRPQEEEWYGGKDLEPSGFQVGKPKFPIGKLRDKLTVEVSPDKCARYGFCEHEAPDVFALQSDGRFGYQAAVSMDKMDRVVRAMEVCPRRAIHIKLPRNS